MAHMQSIAAPARADQPVGHHVVSPPSTLTPYEMAAVRLGQQDPISSLDPPGPISKLFGWMGGARGLNSLADPHLEAIRRAVILTRSAPDATAEEVATLRAAGFNPDQIRSVQEFDWRTR